MIILGVVLIVLALLFPSTLLFLLYVGSMLATIGLLLLLLGIFDGPVHGRRHYW